MGIDKGGEDRLELGRFQSPELAGLFRGDRQMGCLLKLLTNEGNPFAHTAGAVSLRSRRSVHRSLARLSTRTAKRAARAGAKLCKSSTIHEAARYVASARWRFGAPPRDVCVLQSECRLFHDHTRSANAERVPSCTIPRRRNLVDADLAYILLAALMRDAPTSGTRDSGSGARRLWPPKPEA